MNLKIIVLSEKSQMKKNTWYMIALTQNFKQFKLINLQ